MCLYSKTVAKQSWKDTLSEAKFDIAKLAWVLQLDPLKLELRNFHPCYQSPGLGFRQKNTQNTQSLIILTGLKLLGGLQTFQI